MRPVLPLLLLCPSPVHPIVQGRGRPKKQAAAEEEEEGEDEQDEEEAAPQPAKRVSGLRQQPLQCIVPVIG